MIFPAVNLQSEMGISHGQGFFFRMVFETNQIQSFISIYGCIQICQWQFDDFSVSESQVSHGKYLIPFYSTDYWLVNRDSHEDDNTPNKKTK